MTRRNTPRHSERGSAMLVTLILIAALLAGVAVLVSLQLTTSKSTELTRNGLASLHCAEAGLAVSHKYIADQKNEIKTHIAAFPYTTSATTWQVQPTILTTFFATASPNMSDIDNDGASGDFVVWVIDDDDEKSSTQIWTTDSNNRIWIISRCTKYPDAPKEVRELVEFDPSATLYEWQDGRSFGNSNANTIQ